MQKTEITNSLTIIPTCAYKLIYIYRIPNSLAHNGLLKIGDASLENIPADKKANDFKPNCTELNIAAKHRIDKQTKTAGIEYELLYTEIAVDNNGNAFRDYDVHRVLDNSNIKKERLNKSLEWYRVDLETAKNAIIARKEGKSFLDSANISHNKSPIEFRPEQKAAITETLKKFKNPGSRFLWNAKMRFGKTLSALELVKRKGFLRTIIVTHRPAVSESWFEDFGKIFYESNNKYNVGAKIDNRASFKKLENALINDNRPYVYFASMQDLRGSEIVAGERGIDKNNEVFSAKWDCVIIDEAHEGTQTDRGTNVLTELTKSNKPCVLALSGTPFNIVGKYSENEIYTWDYVMEQQAKFSWEDFDKPNPYASLPRMNLYAYSLEDLGDYINVEDNFFNFSEFFKIGEDKKFVHENDVKSFLDLLVGKSKKTKNYPFANKEFRSYFHHTFWLVPGVEEAVALTKLLRDHDIFGQFKIVNVAGNDKDADDPEEEEKKALSAVKNAIRRNDYTITISCRRLTTGVTVPEWTAVLYLAGSSKTSAAAYFQTIFRVQSPGSVNGRAKEECYAFDFSPNRVLQVIEEVAQFSAGIDKKAKNREGNVKRYITDMSTFMPIIAIEGSESKKIDADYILTEIKRIYITQVVQTGFESSKLFNNKVWHLGNEVMKKFKELEGCIGRHSGNNTEKPEVVITENPIPDTETPVGDNYETDGKSMPHSSSTTSKEENERRKNRQTAIAILFNASVRVPLLVFGAEGDVKKEFTTENFTTHFDDNSWKEFMGKLTKEQFNELVAPYFEETIFKGACTRIRERVYAADKLPILERIRKIVGLHSEFKNPDKETVLTPWRVVNMQLGDCLGGYNFYDEEYKTELSGNIRFIDHSDVTKNTLANPNAKILELNSKTGLYPLYVAYSLMQANFQADTHSPHKNETVSNAEKRFWNTVISNNLFIICRTKMAAAITKRTLLGFDTDTKVNIIVEEDLITRVKEDKDAIPKLVSEIKDPQKWNFNEKTEMNFNAIVGNPPYQISDGGAQASASPVYHLFVNLAKNLEPEYFSMIMPARWYSGGKGLDEFRKEMLNDTRIKVLSDYFDSTECFPGVDISGGVCYFLWERDFNGKCKIISHLNGSVSEVSRPLVEDVATGFIRFNSAVPIVKKIQKKEFSSFAQLISPRKPFGLETSVLGKEKSATRSVKLYANKNKSKKDGYIELENIPENSDWISKHKVLISYAYGERGAFPYLVLGKPFYGEPNSACTETYLVIGPFKDKETCSNVMSYIRTRFFRFLVVLRKNTQHATSFVYNFVPMQDFSPSSDIDWKQSIQGIDKQLYTKYGLTAEEISFIESMIRPM